MKRIITSLALVTLFGCNPNTEDSNSSGEDGGAEEPADGADGGTDQTDGPADGETDGPAGTTDDGGDDNGGDGAGTLQLSTASEAFPVGVAMTSPAVAESVATVPPLTGGTLAVDAGGLALLESPLWLQDEVDFCDLDLDTPYAPSDFNNTTDTQYVTCQGKKTYGERLQQQFKLLSGTADSCFRRRWIQPVTMMQADTCFTFNMDEPLKQPDGRVCSAAYAQFESEKVSAVVDMGLLLLGSAICQSEKDSLGVALPTETGKTASLKTALEAAFTEAGEPSKVDLAEVKLIGAESDRPVYRTQINLSGMAEGVAPHAVKDLQITLIHHPPAKGKADFDGILWLSFQPNDPGNSGNRRLMSLRYAHRGETVETLQATYEIRYVESIRKASGDANFLAVLANASGVLDFGLGVADGDAENKIDSSIFPEFRNTRYGAIDHNPWSSAGGYAFFQNPADQTADNAWQEDSPGIVIGIQDGIDNTTGCGAAGSMVRDPNETLGGGISIRRALAEGIDMIPTGKRESKLTGTSPCLFNASDPGNPIEREYVYHQCFKADGAKGYVIDAEKTSDATIGCDPVKWNELTVTPPDLSALPTYSINVVD